MEKHVYIYRNGQEKAEDIKGLEELRGWSGKTVLAFSPHADDLSIAAGGFLHLLSRNNEVQPVLGFTGWRGINNGLTKEQAVAVREVEMTKEAKVLKIKEPIFLKLLTYEEDDDESRDKDARAVQDLLETTQPDIIFLPSRSDSQPRHSLLANYVWQAVEKAGCPAWLVYYETPWSLFSAEQINLLVPLEKKSVGLKIKAIRAHATQLARTNFVRISQTMLEYRALTIPEQKVNGFGSQANLGRWIEVYRLRKNDGY